MAKLVIPKENLPDLSVYTGSVDFRFRITTDDKNVSSYWSPVYSLNPTNPITAEPDVGPTSFSGSGEILIDSKTDYASIVWNPVTVSNDLGSYSTLEYYDVWIKLSPGSFLSSGYWSYSGRVRSTSTNIIIPFNFMPYERISVEIYRPAKPALRISKSEVYQSSDYINISSDVISFPYAHDFVTGDAVVYTSATPVGGLINGVTYYARTVSANEITLHPTRNNAISNTNKMNITSNNTALGFFGRPECPACEFLIYSKYNYPLA
jgi:hypothetical protein